MMKAVHKWFSAIPHVCVCVSVYILQLKKWCKIQTFETCEIVREVGLSISVYQTKNYTQKLQVSLQEQFE